MAVGKLVFLKEQLKGIIIILISFNLDVFNHFHTDDDVFYLFLQTQKRGAELHIITLRKVRTIRGCLDAVQANEGFQVIACETAALLSHLVTRCGEETFRRG